MAAALRYGVDRVAEVGEATLGFPVLMITHNYEIRLVEEALAKGSSHGV